MASVSLIVNGTPVSGEVEARTLLVHFLREHLRLTGTHVGCETSYCGACTVLVDGAPLKSCTLLALQAEGRAVTTIEGMAATDGELHPVQEGFRQRHGLQCGFCTPGMIMSAAALLADDDDPDDAAVRHAIDGNLCRCTGYQNIVASVQYAAAVMRGDEPAPAEWESG